MKSAFRILFRIATQVFILCSSSLAYAGTTTLVSVDSDDNQAVEGSFLGRISGDGRFVAFVSNASSLVPGDTNGVSDVFVRDTLEGTTERVSIGDAENEANGWSTNPAISTNARYVAFQSAATNLDPSLSVGGAMIYVRDRVNNTTEYIDNIPFFNNAWGPAISPDGRFVAYSSYADSSYTQIILFDRDNKTKELISVTNDGLPATGGNSSTPSISSDGHFVSYQSEATNLDLNDTNGSLDVFVRDRINSSTKRVSLQNNGNEWTGSQYGGSGDGAISGDGRFVAFYAAYSNKHIYLRDTVNNTTTLVTTTFDENGYYGISNSTQISLDGQYVTYESYASNLVANDDNGLPDIFIWNRVSGTTELVSTADNGDHASGSSFVPSISADGRFVTFHSDAANLVINDENAVTDIFVRDRGNTDFEFIQTFNDPNPTGGLGDRFGTSVAINGNNILIGAYGDDTNGVDTGQGHLFDVETGELLRTFDDPNPTNSGRFGFAVAIDDFDVLIGAPFHERADGANVGQAHLFDAATGILLQTFDDPTVVGGSDQFGISVAIAGNYVLIGASGDDTGGVNAGQAHMFDVMTGKLLHTFENPTPVIGGDVLTGSDAFGYAVAIDGNYALVGAAVENISGKGYGRAHLFDTATGVLLRTFESPTATVSGDGFGFSVAIDGNNILIGAFGDDTNGVDVGRAHLFDAATGNLLHTLDDPTTALGDNFGWSVAIDGKNALVGAHFDSTVGPSVGQAHVFDVLTGNLIQTLDDPTPTLNDNFGSWVAIDGVNAVIGAPLDDSNGINVGQAFLLTDISLLNLDLEFPLDTECTGLPCTAYTAEISSVMDHSGTPLDSNLPPEGSDAWGWYAATRDGVVEAYTGEKGDSSFGSNSSPSGYKQDAEGTPFIVSGNYVGVSSDGGNAYLNYDGHAGYDYPYTAGTPIIAPADGWLHKASSDSVNGTCGSSTLTAWEAYHTFYIDHENGYTTWFLHASTLADEIGTEVDASGKVFVTSGQTIAYVGAYSKPEDCDPIGEHLHFEVRSGVDEIIDPYKPKLWLVGPPPAIPANLLPGSETSPGPTLDNDQVELSWDAISNATEYEVAVRNLNTDTLVVDAIVNSTSLLVELDLGTPYRWNLRACDANSCSGHTVPLYFQTPIFDADGDGIPDDWEVENGLDPSDPSDAVLDTDGDGLSNLQEYLEGTNPTTEDSDSDGYTDGEEVLMGSSPSDPDSVPLSDGPITDETVRVDSSCMFDETKQNVAVVVHGWNSSPASFANDLAAKIRENEDWEACAYDWSADAGTGLWGIPPILGPAVDAWFNAWPHGRQLGAALLCKDYKNIHFIAHSAGSKLIQTAVEYLDTFWKWQAPECSAGSKPQIHTTFLDAFDPRLNDSTYGMGADWAEQFVDKRTEIDANLTEIDLKYAFNFDISDLDPVKFYPIIDGFPEMHAWPYRWYNCSAAISNEEEGLYPPCLFEPFGFPVSLEAGNSLLPPMEFYDYSTTYFPGGKGCVLKEGVEPDCGVSPSIEDTFDVPESIFTTTPSLPASLEKNSSSTGTVDQPDSPFDSFTINLATGSPAWANWLVDVTDPFNSIRFNFEFLNSAEGLLSVYFDKHRVSEFDERLDTGGVTSSGTIWVGDIQPGIHSIGFRLDAFSATQSSIQITNVEPGTHQVILVPRDTDQDGVPDVDDICPNTTIPELAPTSSLGKNRWTLVSQDGKFTQAPPQAGSSYSFTTTDTGGCSCEQIVSMAGLGKGHLKNGCSTSALLDWVDNL